MLPIPGIPGYLATDDGGVVGKLGQPLKQRLIDGYPVVTLKVGKRRRWYFVHRLVLMAHRGESPEGYEARHLNGDRLDNRLENLAWGTHAENVQDAVRHGTARALKRGAASIRAKLSDDAVRAILAARGQGRSARIVGEEFGVTGARVSQLWRGYQWTYA